MSKFIVIDKYGNETEYDTYEDLANAVFKQDQFAADIIMESEDSGYINLDNGERVVYGEERPNGSWICVQGLWMYYHNDMESEVLPSGGIVREADIWHPERLYTKVDPINREYSRGLGTSSFQVKGYELLVSPSGTGKGVQVREGSGTSWTDTWDTGASYKDDVMKSYIENGSQYAADTLDSVGIMFNVLEIYPKGSTGNVTMDQYGGVKVMPRLGAFGKKGNEIVSLKTGCRDAGRNIIYQNAGFCSMLKKYSSNPQLYLFIPFKNDLEYNFAMGITDIYKKIPIEALNDENNSGD